MCVCAWLTQCLDNAQKIEKIHQVLMEIVPNPLAPCPCLGIRHNGTKITMGMIFTIFKKTQIN